jgi:hypothetical protein
MRRRRSAAVAVTPSALSSTTFTAKKRRLKRSPPVVRLSSTATTDQLTPQVTMPCEEAHVNTGVSLMDLPDELLDHIVSFTSAALIGPDIKPNGMPYKRAGPFLALAQTNKRLNEICNAPRPPIAVTVPVYDTTQDSKIYAYNFNLGSPQPGQPMPPYRSRVVIGEKTVMRQMPSRAEFQKRLHACHLCKRYNRAQWTITTTSSPFTTVPVFGWAHVCRCLYRGGRKPSGVRATIIDGPRYMCRDMVAQLYPRRLLGWETFHYVQIQNWMSDN